jgi:hypothetical protein
MASSEGRQMAQTLEPKRTQPPDPAHFAESSARENLIEHVFLGELLRGLWRRNVRDLEVLRPEVDSGGYDLALEFKGLTRHVQLKSSFTGARQSDVTASVKLRQSGPSARARVVRQEAAGEALTMTAQPRTAPWVAGVYTAGWGPPAGTGTEAGMTASV